MNKFIVITSINPPTEAVKKFAGMKDYQLIVVGDKKTPAGWKCDNVIYLSVTEQQKLGYRILNRLPLNTYNRKMIGYLYAIQQGAEVIVDSDDDNIPYDSWSFLNFIGNYVTLDDDMGFVNVFSYFTFMDIWPRGYPLKLIHEQNRNHVTRKTNNVGVWCGLVNGDTDVDAIYRLTNNKPCYFEGRVPLVLGRNTVCPFNSENTIFRKELFPLLYLPSFCGGRANDIFRGLIAQPIMWNYGYHLGFTPATVMQVRNPHDYLKDFEQEIDCYLYSEKVFEITKKSIKPKNSMIDNLSNSYITLLGQRIVKGYEIELLTDWLIDLKEVGYEFIH